ncbi:Pentatricopeptide repeat-containing protein [Durusdinium trenchii]|uniref:Chloroplastic n=1 Tax=Durusdinium trenchii TaxID=1381693 RepID=A0ABP0JM45_9DINO
MPSMVAAHSLVPAEFWVDDYGAGSSELSDAAADKYGLKRRLTCAKQHLCEIARFARSFHRDCAAARESFRNGRPPGWGEGEINIDGKRFSRVAPMHPDTLKPLGEGCAYYCAMTTWCFALLKGDADLRCAYSTAGRAARGPVVTSG